MTELVYENEIYERIMELEHIAKTLYIRKYFYHLLYSDWDDVIGMLSDDDRKEYDELMVMWDEIQDDYVGDEEE